MPSVSAPYSAQSIENRNCHAMKADVCVGLSLAAVDAGVEKEKRSMQTSHWLTLACFAGLSAVPASAAARAGSTAKSLSHGEREALLAGNVVSRPLQFESERGSYRGGVAYALVHAPAAAVLAALSNVDSLPQALPHTKAARLIDVRGGFARVELVHAGDTAYTVRIQRSADGAELRFWLDESRPHDIADVFGFFRAEPFGEGETLVTVATLLDLGAGLTRFFFGDAVERALLGSPGQIRTYVEPRALALLESRSWAAGF
jgi:hypothetical protein